MNITEAEVESLRRQERAAWATWSDHLASCASCQRVNARTRHADVNCSAGAGAYGDWRIASRKHLAALNPSYSMERGHYA